MIVPLIFAAVATFSSQDAAPAEQVVGPAEVCFPNFRFTLAEGERIDQIDAGVHAAQVTVSKHGRRAFTVSENEAVRQPENLGRLVMQTGDLKVFAQGGRRSRSYAFVRPMDFYQGAETVIGWVEGPILTGRAGDAAIYGRFKPPSDQPCDTKVEYGWHLFLGG